MYHDLVRQASFWEFLFTVDQNLAETARQQKCSCGGRLHRADFLRKPRGGPQNLPDTYSSRFSFCCDRDGCRKRVTPPSVRFLGRKVYLGAIVVLVAAMRQGPTPRRVRELFELFGVGRRTINRWRDFWKDLIPRTVFWKVERSRLVPQLDVATAILPRALWELFVRSDGDQSGWQRLLQFLSPISITGGLKIAGAD